MKRITHKKKIIFLSFLVVFVYGTFELISFTFYLTTKRKVFSFSEYQSIRQSLFEPERVTIEQGGSLRIQGGTHEVIHPYLGYVYDPTKENNISEDGFFETAEFLTNPEGGQLSIGIFGGSFAAHTSIYSGETLIKHLRSFPEFRDKNIRLYTIALGGYKQPQQSLALNYLLTLGTHFDIVINIDGFNEVVLPGVSNLPKNVFPFYPRAWFARVQSFYDTHMLLTMGEIALLKKRQQNWARLIANTPLHYSITSNIVWGFYNRYLFNQRMTKEIALQQYKVVKEETPNYLAMGPAFFYGNKTDLYTDLTRVWREGSIQMHKNSVVQIKVPIFIFCSPTNILQARRL